MAGLAVLAYWVWVEREPATHVMADAPRSTRPLASSPGIAGNEASAVPGHAVSMAATPVHATRTVEGPQQGLFGLAAIDWYRRALGPAATVRDRMIASRVDMICVTSQGHYSELAARRQTSLARIPASSPDVGAQELSMMAKLQNVSAEQWAAVQALQDYCASAEGFDFLTALKKDRTRSFEYFDLALVDRPAQKRFPLLSTALSSPLTHDVEMGIWAEQDLREILESRDGLNPLQSWHARGWLLQQVMGASGQVDMYWQLQCAWFGYCRSLNLLSEGDRQTAENVARRVLVDLQRQDWPRLIYRRSG